MTAQTTCGTSTTSTVDDVIVTVNCDARYTLAIPKYRNEYTRGEAIVIASDPDGAITGASIIMGSVPPRIIFNSVTGALTVDVPSALVEGIYRLPVRLVDNLGGVTLTAITLRIFGESPVIVPLPVELDYFRATVQNGTVNQQRLTASEKDNKAFEVERSADEKAFEGIGTVQGYGNSSVPISTALLIKPWWLARLITA